MRKLTILLTALLAVACGKDKSAEDYAREKLQQNLAQYQLVEGTYTGVVTSNENGSVIGAMSLNLKADTKANPSQGGDSPIGSPILLGNISFLDESVISLGTQASYYDPNSNYYSADIKIQRYVGIGENAKPNGDPETITIGGYFNGGVLNGSVRDQRFPSYGGSFSLTKNGRDIRELLKEARPGRGGGTTPVRNFLGTTTFASGEQREVNIVLLQARKGTPEDFLDLVNPIKSVRLSLNYSRELGFNFIAALYDASQGQVTGDLSLTYKLKTQNMSINCRTADGVHLVCDHLSSGAGLVARSEAELQRGPITDPPGSPSDGGTIDRAYEGKTVVDGEKRTVRLTVTYFARQLFDELMELFFPTNEKLVNVAFRLSEHAAPVFTNARWDGATGLLDGKSDSNSEVVKYIRCTGFYFTKQKDPFVCRYWSSRSEVIEVTFRPINR